MISTKITRIHRPHSGQQARAPSPFPVARYHPSAPICQSERVQKVRKRREHSLRFLTFCTFRLVTQALHWGPRLGPDVPSVSSALNTEKRGRRKRRSHRGLFPPPKKKRQVSRVARVLCCVLVFGSCFLSLSVPVEDQQHF